MALFSKLVIFATSLLGGAVAFDSPVITSTEHESCPVDSPISCSTSTDSCCIEGTNGLFLQTQFWDYDPATGPDDVWTIHGLWSDKCNGGYDQFCNPSWEIKGDPTPILQDLGDDELLKTMQQNWKNYDGADSDLWEHEFNKHGTCMATVNPNCYTEGSKYQYVGDFFNTVVNLWQTLPSYKFLAAAGISPDSSKTHTVDDFKKALTSHVDGSDVYLGCDSSNAITEIWYFFKLKGSVASGTFIPTDSVTKSTCKDGFKWLPKNGDGSSPSPPPHDPGQAQSGYLNLSGQPGCLISDGTWFTSGTCATYKIATSIGGVTVASSKGACNVVDGIFTCGGGVSPGDFTLDSNNNLQYGGSSTWSANQKASGQAKVPVSPGSGAVTFDINFSPK